MDFPHKGRWRGAEICAGDVARHRAHYDVTVMWLLDKERATVKTDALYGDLTIDIANWQRGSGKSVHVARNKRNIEQCVHCQQIVKTLWLQCN